MKIKTIWFVAILIVLATIFINITLDNEEEEFKPIELNVGDVFSGVEYENTMYVLNYIIGDVTGDEKKDMIILVGEKESPDADFAKNVDIVVYDTENEKFLSGNIKKYEGKSPKILLNDLTDDGLDDILIYLENENKEKDVRILVNKNDLLKEIFGIKDNKGINFIGEMIDGVKAHIRCNKLNKELYVDLSDMKAEFINNKNVDESGKIISENKKVSTNGFTRIEIIKINDEYGIETTQFITAFDNDTIIDEITAIWKYEEGKWQIKEARGTRMGNLIY